MVKTRPLVFGAFLAIATACVVFFWNSNIVGPMIQADESSYIANAAALAGYPNDLANSYHAGYSLFLVPAAFFADAPSQLWLGVKIVNAGLFFALVMGLWLLAAKLSPDLSVGTRAGSVLVVSAYPMWVVMAGYSFAQMAFAPVFVWVCYFFLRSISGSWTWVVLLGVSVGFLYWIHPTGVAPLLAMSVAYAYIALKTRSAVRVAVLIVLVCLLALFYKYGFTAWLHNKMSLSGAPPNLHYRPMSDLLSPLVNIDQWLELFTRLAGHLFYVIVGSVGLALIGIKRIVGENFRIYGRADGQVVSAKPLGLRGLAIFLVLSFVGVLALSVLLFTSHPGADRLDRWMYGRYVEGVIAPILLIGALAASFRAIVWGIPIVIITGVLFWCGLNDYTHIAYFNISSFWQAFVLRDQGVWAWLASGVVVFALLAFIPRKGVLLVVALVFLYGSYLQISWHERASLDASQRWDSALEVRSSWPKGSCVGFDHSEVNTYNKRIFWFDFGFILFDYKLMRLSAMDWYESCEGPLFTYDTELLDRFLNVRPEAISGRDGPVLYSKGSFSNEIYPLIVAERSPALVYVLKDGWHSLERRFVWSGESARMKLPIPARCQGADCAFSLALAAFGASKDRTVDVNIILSQGQSERKISTVIVDSSEHVMQLPIIVSENAMMDVTVEVPQAVSPASLGRSADARVLGVALRRIDLGSREGGYCEDHSCVRWDIGD